jgi:molybdenum cofactor cytidylyltransferase
MSGISAIILAAGESRRMGFPKMLLVINGRPMLENVIINVCGSDVDHTLVVLGAEKKALEEIADKLHVKHCYNDNYREGMLSSVKCGISNLSSDTEAVLVFQGDQPFINSDIINKVIKGYRSSGKGIVVPVHDKRRGHPLMIDKKYFKEIEMLSALDGLHSLPHKFSQDVLEVGSDDPGILRDFDTYEEYNKVINKII